MIHYRSGYKHQLVGTYDVSTTIRLDEPVQTQFMALAMDGKLTIFSGYAWDGATGAIPTTTIIRASLVHDALYGLLRQGLIPAHHRMLADDLLRAMCIEDGMWRIRAWWIWQAVRRLASSAASPASLKEVRTAP